jgi:hypothetical protein
MVRSGALACWCGMSFPPWIWWRMGTLISKDNFPY